VTAALAAEGLELYNTTSHLSCLRPYVQDGVGSLEAVVEAARERRAQQQAREARNARLSELMVAEGLPGSLGAISASSMVVWGYLQHGEGSEEEAMAAVREAGLEEAARRERRAGVTAALAAEGFELEEYRYGSGVGAYIQQGTGTVEEGERKGDGGDGGVVCWVRVGFPWGPACRREDQLSSVASRADV